MVTKVGEDSFGKDTTANYIACGISQEGILTTAAAATGLAMINVGRIRMELPA